MEELIDGKIVLSMRAIYQSKLGLGLLDTGIYWLLNGVYDNTCYTERKVQRSCYKSLNLVLFAVINIGAKELLQNISEKQGRKMNSLESAKDIPKFVEFFKVCLSLLLSIILWLILYDFLKMISTKKYMEKSGMCLGICWYIYRT